MKFAGFPATIAVLAIAAPSFAQQTRVRVTLENLAPEQATFQTPVWVGFHDGSFDLYDRGQPADHLLPNEAIERLAEDGNTGPLSEVFARSSRGSSDGTIPGPNGPIAPGDGASGAFLLDPLDPLAAYFSYATMVIPSNDAFVALGDPLRHRVFDEFGAFVGQNFFIAGTDILDAGTEVNDEIPENTAFFGQMDPDTGVDENGVVHAHSGFLPFGSGGILDDFRFQEGGFTDAGYPVAKVRLEAAPAVTDFRVHLVLLTGQFEVPPVDTPALGVGVLLLDEAGTSLKYFFRFFDLENVVAGHLHLAPFGENGPVSAGLLDPQPPGGGAFNFLFGEVGMADLVGPFQARPLDALSAALQAGDVYVNMHTDDGMGDAGTGPGDFPSGEVRGQVFLIE